MICPKCGANYPDGAAFCPSCGAETRDPTAKTVGISVAAMDDPLLVALRDALEKDYAIERELGRGGMAVVYQGREKGLEREVAIKVLPPEMALQGGTADRFKREARLAAALDHPNIIPIYRVGEAVGLHYMAMKYVRGRALDSIIEQQGALPVPLVLRVLHAAASGLAYAHEHHIVHRDIKGANILIELDGRVLVSDFGIARAMTETSITASGMVIGTPNFMSPEQCGGQKVGPQSDQYSLGVLAFQMLSGQLPFEADDIMQVIQHHYMTPPPDLRAIREGLPEELLAIVYRALAKKPDERFANTQELADTLEAVPQTADERRASLALLKQLANGDAIPTVRTGSLPPLALATGPGAAAAAAAATVALGRAKPARRRRLMVLAAGGTVAVLAGAGVVWQLVLKSPAAQPTTPGSRTGAEQTATPGPTAAPGPGAAQPAGAAGGTARQATRQPAGQPATAKRPAQEQVAAPAPAAYGDLLIRTTPASAQVVVNGDAWRLGGETRHVPVGSYTVSVSAEGCETKTATVTVEPGKMTRDPVTLTCQQP
ncbi:MAG: protein kinase [Gemmatimonadales bacterium]